MSIEFRCEQCQFLLRTGDDSVGKKARCPQCGNIQIVTAQANDISPVEPQVETPFHTNPTPQPVQQPPQNPFAVDPAPNPYEAATSANPAPLPSASVRSKVIGPAIANLVASILSILLTALVILGGIINVVEDGMADDDAIMFVMFGVSIFLLLLSAVGAIQMLRQRTYGLAVTAVIVAVVPTNCLWCLTLPFGIWGLVVLLDPEVRKSFR